MAQTTSKTRMAQSIDAIGSNPSPWYLDFHLPNGGCDEKIHLFFQDKEQSPFKDCGVSGQHSIMQARSFILNQSTKYASRKEFYKYRVARIVVDAPKEVVVRISKMENIETQTSMKTQPYVEVLKHGRGQWIAYSCPSKPKAGVPVGHESRRL